MTTFNPVYRATVYEGEAMSTALTPPSGAPHSDELKIATADLSGFQPYMEIPQGRRGEIKPKSRETDIGQMALRVLDKRTDTVNTKRWLSAFVGVVDGRPVKVEESTDGGSTWSDFYVGRVHKPHLDGRLFLGLEVRDRNEDRSDDIFVGEPHPSVSYAFRPSVIPVGLTSTWGSAPTIGRLPGTYSDNRIAVDLGSMSAELSKRNIVTREARRLMLQVESLRTGLQIFGLPRAPIRVHAEITSGARSGESGIFRVGRGAVSGGIFSIGRTAFGTGPRGDGHERLTSVAIAELDSSHPDHISLPSNGTDVEFELRGDHDVSEENPLFIQGIHPVQLWKDIERGYFGLIDDGGDPAKTYNPDTSAFDTLIADDTFPEFRGIIRETKSRREWLPEFLKAYGLAHYVDKSGQVVPVDFRAPESSPATTIDAADLVPDDAPQWTKDRDEAIDVVALTYYADDPVEPEGLKDSDETYPEAPAGLIDSRELELRVVNAEGLDGDIEVHEIDAFGYRFIAGVEDSGNQSREERILKQLEGVADDLRVPYATAPERAILPCLRSGDAGSVSQGDTVVVDLDELPNPDTAERGGQRVYRVLGTEEDGPRIRLILLDLKQAQGADPPTLADPTVDSGSDGRHTVHQDVTLNASDQPAVVHYAVTDTSTSTRPAEGSSLWTFAERITADGTVDIEGLPAGRRVWTRGRTQPDDELPSDWAFPSGDFVDTNSLPSITGLSVDSITGSKADITWTPGATDIGIELVVEDTTASETLIDRRLPAGTTGFRVSGLTAGNDHSVTVRHSDRFAGLGPATSTTFTAGQDSDQSARMQGIGIFSVGADLGDPDARFGLPFYLFPGDSSQPIEIQIAADDGTGEPDTSNIVEQTTLEPGSDRYVYENENVGFGNNDLFHGRARHNAEGLDPGDWTGWKGALLRSIPQDLGPPPPEPVASVDLVLNRDTGDVRLRFDGDDGTASIRYDTSKSDYPQLSETSGGSGSLGTVVNTDAAGDVNVSSIGTISRGETLYVTVRSYRQKDADGPFASITRISIPFDDPDAGDVGLPPKPEAEPLRTTAPLQQQFQLRAVAGEGGTSSLEVRFKTSDEFSGEGSWSAWKTAPTTETVSRFPWQRQLLVQARDTGLPNNPTSDVQSFPIDPWERPLDIPPLGRGPFEDDRFRSGMGGETPGGERLKSPVYSAPGDTELIDTENERMVGGDLGPGRTQNDGAGNHSLSKGWDSKTGRNGDSISWDPTYQNTPSVDPPGHGGVRKRDSGWSGDGTEPGTYGPSIRLKNKDAGGGDVEALLREPTGSITNKSIASWTVVSSGSELEADKTDPDEAWDDEYYLRHHYFVSGAQLGGDCFGKTMEVGYYFDKGSGWVKFDTNTFSSGCNDVEADTSQTLVEDGISDTDQEGANFRVKQESGSGSISDPDSGDAVTWEEAVDPKETDATPSGSAEVSFFAQATA